MKIKRFVMISALTLAIAIPQLVGVTAAVATEPSSSGGWLLAGTAVLATDPENSANDVVKIQTNAPSGPFFGQVSRTVNVKINKLDNMLEFKARFTAPKSCAGGSPRIQLAIDTDGNGVSNGNAFGAFGAATGFNNCLPGTWLYEDLTGGDTIGGVLPSTGQTTPNEAFEWNLSPEFGVLLPLTWSQVEAFFNDNHPNHKVCTVALIDDVPVDPVTGLPLPEPGQSGIAHYDLISGGRATWVDGSDIAGRGIAKGCGQLDRPDDGPTGDKDHDGDYDPHDDQFNQYRKQRWGNG
jgi:hypothetical protein